MKRGLKHLFPMLTSGLLAWQSMAGSATFERNFARTRVGLESRLKNVPNTVHRNNSEDKYGIILSTDPGCEKIVSLAYRTLRNSGYDSKNVFVLDTDGNENYYYPSDGMISARRMVDVLELAADTSDDKDNFFLYLDVPIGRTDNGSQNFLFEDGSMLPLSTFQIKMSRVRCRQGIVVLGRTYSNEFIDEYCKTLLNRNMTFILHNPENPDGIGNFFMVLENKERGYERKSVPPELEMVENERRKLEGIGKVPELEVIPKEGLRNKKL